MKKVVEVVGSARKAPVARYRGYMVEVTMKMRGGEGVRVFLGRHERSVRSWAWEHGNTHRKPSGPLLADGLASPGVFYSAATLKKAIQNSLEVMNRHSDMEVSYRIIPITIEVKLRERVPLGYIPESSIAALFRQLKARESRSATIRRRRRRLVTLY